MMPFMGVIPLLFDDAMAGEMSRSQCPIIAGFGPQHCALRGWPDAALFYKAAGAIWWESRPAPARATRVTAGWLRAISSAGAQRAA
jgi:hypothetical protein